jgi:hypothetical protein
MSQASNPMQNQCWLDLYLDNWFKIRFAAVFLTPFELLLV